MQSKPDRKGIELLAKVFHDLVAGKTDPHEQKILKLIQDAVERKFLDNERNIHTIAKTSLEIAERLTALEDQFDELVATMPNEKQELSGWVH